MTRHCVTCVENKVHEPLIATFGEIGKSPMYCKGHMKEDMINMKDPRCNCGKSAPSYNFKEEPPLYCIDCKEVDMVNVKSKMCIDCTTRKPSFNVFGKTAQYCGVCVKKNKYTNMVNVNNKMCAEGHHVKPSYNYPGKPAEYCVNHKKEGMINVNKKTCKYETCSSKPSFNVQDKPAEFCAKHKAPGMINVITKK